MPIVKITIRKGKSSEYKKALLDGVHEALVQAFKIPEHDRFQMLYELDKDCFEAPSNKTDNVTVIEATVFKCRSNEAKMQLYKAIVDNLAMKNGYAIKKIIV